MRDDSRPRDPQHDTGLLARPAIHLAVLASLALVLCLAGVAGQPLDGDPAMYATIAKTIATTDEWTRLSVNAEPYMNKPPLHFWLNALVFRVLPATTFTATLLPGLLGVADTLLVYGLCRAMFAGWQTAFAAALVYITTPEVVHWSRGVHLETLVTFWVLIGLLAAYRSVTQPVAIVLLGIAAAGGVLSKGPQGLFPVGVALVLWMRAGVVARRVMSRWTLVAVAILLAAVGPWLWARVGEGSDFARTYFGGQIGHVLFIFGGRAFDRGPLWYVGKLFRTYWPWLPVAAFGLVLLWRRAGASLGARLWLVYAAIVMVVISLAAGKKSRYLFQLYPALAAAAGMALAAAAERRPGLLRWLLVPATVAAVLVAFIGGERVSPKQAMHTRDALAVAAQLGESERVWLTWLTQHGDPGVGKILGFYSRPLLRTCRDQCEEAPPGALVVARGEEVALVAGRGATVEQSTATLSVLRIPR